MIIVKPLIIYVMMERKYQLVAWTENITDNENARLYMIPSLECEVQADLVTDLTFIHQEEYKFHGPISLDLARRAVRACENMSRFEILTGHLGDGIRYIFTENRGICVSVILISRKTRNVVWSFSAPQDVKEWRI